jgi:hypothetical protein
MEDSSSRKTWNAAFEFAPSLNAAGAGYRADELEKLSSVFSAQSMPMYLVAHSEQLVPLNDPFPN